MDRFDGYVETYTYVTELTYEYYTNRMTDQIPDTEKSGHRNAASI